MSVDLRQSRPEELPETGWQGQCFLVTIAEAVEEDPDTLDSSTR